MPEDELSRCAVIYTLVRMRRVVDRHKTRPGFHLDVLTRNSANPENYHEFTDNRR